MEINQDHKEKIIKELREEIKELQEELETLDNIGGELESIKGQIQKELREEIKELNEELETLDSVESELESIKGQIQDFLIFSDSIHKYALDREKIKFVEKISDASDIGELPTNKLDLL